MNLQFFSMQIHKTLNITGSFYALQVVFMLGLHELKLLQTIFFPNFPNILQVQGFPRGVGRLGGSSLSRLSPSSFP